MPLTDYRVDFECIPAPGQRISKALLRSHQPELYYAAKYASEEMIADLKLGLYLDVSSHILASATVLDPLAVTDPLPPILPNAKGQVFLHTVTFDYVQKGGSTHRRAQLYLGYQPTEAATAHRVDQILRDFLDPVLHLAADQVQWTAQWIGPVSG